MAKVKTDEKALIKELAEKKQELETVKANFQKLLEQREKTAKKMQELAKMILADDVLKKDGGIRLLYAIISDSLT